MNDQYPNSVQPSPIRTVMYAQRNPGERPFAVTMDLNPYNGQPDERFETVQLVPAPAMPTFGQSNPIGSPQQPNYAGWHHPHPQGFDGQNAARPLAQQLNPRHQPMVVIINGFTTCRKFLSGLLCFFNICWTINIITFFMLFLLVSSPHDHFNTTGVITRSMVNAFGLALILLRAFMVPLIACRMPITRNEKIATGFNVIIPYLKFHVFRLNPNFMGRMKTFYTQEWIMALYEVIIGICAIICSNNSYYVTSGGGRYQDPIILLLGIFCLIDALFFFLLFLGIHGSWLKYRVQQEKIAAAAALAAPLLHYQQNVPPPPVDQHGQYQQFMGEPIYPDQSHQYPAPPAPPVPPANQPSPINRPNQYPQYNHGAVQYPDI